MGQLIEGGGASSGTGQGVFKLKAGASIATDDIVQLGPNGKSYPVKCTDYAAVANCNYGTAQTSSATGQIVAQTQVVAGQTLAYSRQAVLQGDDGSNVTFTRSAANTGTTLSKYSAAGALISQVVVDSGASDCSNHHILKLTDGNICVVAHSQLGNISFAIYDQNLAVVKANTAIGEPVPAAGFYFSACALSGGGFAIVYQQSANPLLSRLATYDNTGTAVLAPTTIWTRTGTTGVQYHRMAQLSNGTLAIAVSSANTVSSIGLYYGIVSAAGVPVLAFTSLDATGTQLTAELSVMDNHFAIAKANGANQRAWIFDTTGAQQGGTFTAATAAAIQLNQSKLVNDGSAFWLIWPRSSDSKEVLTKLPVTGTGYGTTIITTTGKTNFNTYIDAFCENGFIVCVSQLLNNGSPFLWVVGTDNASLVASASTDFGVTPEQTGGQGQYQRVIPGCDFSYVCLYDYAGTARTSLAVGKYANTAVMGVAQAAAAADDLVDVGGLAGGYAANYIKGSPSKAFDHNATNIMGNRGALLNYGAVLKGF